MNQLQQPKIAQDKTLQPADPMNPFLSLLGVSSRAGVFWCISQPRPDLHSPFGTGPQKKKKKNGSMARAASSEPVGAATAECGHGFHLHLQGRRDASAYLRIARLSIHPIVVSAAGWSQCVIGSAAAICAGVMRSGAAPASSARELCLIMATQGECSACSGG